LKGNGMSWKKHLKSITRLGTNPDIDIILMMFWEVLVVDMETATMNHVTLNFYKWCSKCIQKLQPKLSKDEVYDIMKGICERRSTVEVIR
jgi:hypothetical protein